MYLSHLATSKLETKTQTKQYWRDKKSRKIRGVEKTSVQREA